MSDIAVGNNLRNTSANASIRGLSVAKREPIIARGYHSDILISMIRILQINMGRATFNSVLYDRKIAKLSR